MLDMQDLDLFWVAQTSVETVEEF